MARRFHKNVLMPLPKKVNAMAYEDHRAISLVPLASKVVLRILAKRLEGKVQDITGKHAVWIQERMWRQRSDWGYANTV